jgi:hypothetical protein
MAIYTDMFITTLIAVLKAKKYADFDYLLLVFIKAY